VSFLKKAKTFDKHATQFQAMSDNLEAQCTALQVANQTKETIQVMGMATKNLKAATLDADAVADIHDEFVETMEMQEEIASVVSQPFSASGIDDDECLAELDDLMASEATTKLATVPSAAAGTDVYGTAALSEFPSVPTNSLIAAPATVPTELDDDLARLQASLA
jgi:charged multivesicular body protein 4